MKFLVRTIVALALLAIISLGSVWYGHKQLLEWSQRPGPSADQTVEYHYAPGTSLGKLAQDLRGLGLVDSPTAFRIYVRLASDYGRFKAGHYRFEPNTAPQNITAILTDGRTYEPVIARITIPEGFTMHQVVNRLVARGIGKKPEISGLLVEPGFIRKLGIRAKTLEGYLYPATYEFHRKMPKGSEALKRMTDEFWKRLPEDYANRAKSKGLSLTEAVAFGSLIERETLHEDEKALVSEVIWRRLKSGDPIGIDAGLIYGIKNYDGDIRWKDLRNAKNPYNSRIHKGLPPTPIGATSVSSLEAVLNPSNFGYRFYVRKPGKEGRHQFTKNLKEHNRFVKEWIKSGN